MVALIKNSTELSLASIRLDGGTQPRAAINGDVVQDYALAMMEGQALPPVTVFYDGTDYWLADGFHRYRAAQQICRDDIEVDIRQGTRREAVLYSVGANAQHGLRRTNEDKRRSVETLLNDEEWAKWSNNEIAKRCATSLDLVNRMRNGGSLNESLSEPRTYITKHGTVATMNTANIGRPQSQETPTERVSLSPGFGLVDGQPFDLPLPDGKPVKIPEDWKLPPRIVHDEILPRGVPPALQMSESNEWYTPAEYVNAARELMGGIDVDPASNFYANSKVVRADTYYDIQTNGLDKEWHGRVWLNPPYGRDNGESNQEAWSRRLIEQFKDGITTEAVLLVNAVTDRKWFQPLWGYSICFTDHRIRFYNQETEAGQPTHGNVLVYLGGKVDRFIALFKQFGIVVIPSELGGVVRSVR